MQTLQRHMLDVINGRYGDMAKLQEQLATGKRLNRPSDDPIDTANALKLRTKDAQFTQFHTNINDGTAFMGVTDTSMVSMNTLMQRTRELALQASSDTMSGTERRYIQKEVDQLVRQMISLGNTNYKGDYIFSGTQTKVQPFPTKESVASLPENYNTRSMIYFDASTLPPGTPVQLRNAFDDSAITNLLPGSFSMASADSGGVRHNWVEGTDYSLDYSAGTITILPTGTDPAALAVDVSDGHAFDAGLNGYYNFVSPNRFTITCEYIGNPQNIYGDIVSNSGDVLREIESGVRMPVNISGDELFADTATGTTMLNTLISFSQDLLYNNRTGIETAITNIDTLFKNILSAQAKNGARMNRFDTTLERNEGQATQSQELLANLEDAELADTATRFAQLQTVYEAALKSAAQIVKPSLVNYL